MWMKNVHVKCSMYYNVWKQKEVEQNFLYMHKRRKRNSFFYKYSKTCFVQTLMYSETSDVVKLCGVPSKMVNKPL